MSQKKIQTIELRDYGDEELNRLAQAFHAFDSMTDEQRFRAFRYLKDKYAKWWPSESYT